MINRWDGEAKKKPPVVPAVWEDSGRLLFQDRSELSTAKGAGEPKVAKVEAAEMHESNCSTVV
jgi:hypothetical protein